MSVNRHHSTPLSRLVHLLLLFGWLLSSQGIAPAVCMAAALLDGDHAVKVGASKDGALTVVLSHAGKSHAELSRHEHDALCRVLLAFAVAPETAVSDHVLAFKPVQDASRSHRLLQISHVNLKAPAPLPLLSFSRPRMSFADKPGRETPRNSWSQGLALKTGRTVMRC